MDHIQLECLFFLLFYTIYYTFSLFMNEIQNSRILLNLLIFNGCNMFAIHLYARKYLHRYVKWFKIIVIQ